MGTPGTRSIDLDEIDLRLVEALSKNGRETNRALARLVSLNESTVTTRVRRIIDDQVLSIRPQIDWQAAGYAVHAFAFLRVRAAPTQVAARCRRIVGVHSVSLLLGNFDLRLSVIARDDRTMLDTLTVVGRDPAVELIEVMRTVDFTNYTHTFSAPIHDEIELDTLPAPVVQLDATDRRIMAELRADGRVPYRKVASRLGVSDGTIGTRVRRLEEAGFMRVTALRNQFKIASSHIVMHVSLWTSTVPAVLKAIAEWPYVNTSATTLGTYNVMMTVSISSPDEINSWLSEAVWKLPGVERVHGWVIVSTPYQIADLARLL